MRCLRFPAVLFLGLALLGAAGCQSTPTAPAVTETQSVKPGINDEFLKPDLNPSNWVERFEKEGREVFDHRQEIVAAAGLKPGQRIADVGAGTGLFTFLFENTHVGWL